MAYTGRASLMSAALASRSIDRQGYHSTIIAPLSLSQKQLSQKDWASGAAIPLSFDFSATRKQQHRPKAGRWVRRVEPLTPPPGEASPCIDPILTSIPATETLRHG
jgi:hypothetical protein